MRNCLGLLFMTTLFALTACDAFSEGRRTPADELELLPIARAYTQTLARWWPLLTQPVPNEDPARGALPFMVPSTFGAAVTVGPGAITRTPSPTAATCGVDCTITWLGLTGPNNDLPYRLRLTTDTSGRLRTGWMATTSPTFGTWKSRINAQGHVTHVSLAEPSPFGSSRRLLQHWRWSCPATAPQHCTFVAGFSQQISAVGTITGEHRQSRVQVAAWAQDFPWPGYPQQQKSPMPTRQAGDRRSIGTTNSGHCVAPE